MHLPLLCWPDVETRVGVSRGCKWREHAVNKQDLVSFKNNQRLAACLLDDEKLTMIVTMSRFQVTSHSDTLRCVSAKASGLTVWKSSVMMMMMMMMKMVFATTEQKTRQIDGMNRYLAR